ncbi:uncharacterized protein CTRU02_213606 [Colletotrichum truncatum]|uniref:Uncharacterized protein n=1 Tax=Colletotrichum truncatum TaxID=5467 RepID=A0ACC3YG96_COLTU|nr:uncharacterized protein CTRU02_11820 [Colletotrichum truncatum]KAF6785520.1 hypothetical protein CTRU02_11820 [Colletotrichum truncatum]
MVPPTDDTALDLEFLGRGFTDSNTTGTNPIVGVSGWRNGRKKLDARLRLDSTYCMLRS